MRGIRFTTIVAITIAWVSTSVTWAGDSASGSTVSGTGSSVIDTPRAQSSAVDPIVEEPIRPLESPSTDISFDQGVAECGTMNGFVLPAGVLLAQGLVYVPRRRRRKAKECETER